MKEVKALKRRLFRAYGSGEAGRVVMHGLRQIKRGRRPSMAFRDVRNPQEALKFAALAWAVEAEVTHQRYYSLWPELHYVERGVYGVETSIGSQFDRAIDGMSILALAYINGVRMANGTEISTGDIAFELKFNDLIIRARHDTHFGALKRDVERAIDGVIDRKKIIGPYPKHELSEEELESDRRIQAEIDERRRLRQEEARRAQDAVKATFQAKLAAAPPMEVSDEAAWVSFKEQNGDRNDGPMGSDYAARIISYAEDWARLMQVEMAAGKALANVLDDTADEANYDGITGFMYGAAVGVLAASWVHGDELRRIHNLKTQINDEGERANEGGGTLNPAIISIG